MKRASVALSMFTAGLLTAALVAALFPATRAIAFTGLGLDQIESLAYKVQSRGTDFRVYEWTPKARPDVVCLSSYSQAGGGSMWCMPKDRGAPTRTDGWE
mgnify:CR=1 FL=1